MNYEEFKENVLRDAENIARELFGDDTEVKIKSENANGEELEVLKVAYSSSHGIAIDLRPLFKSYQKTPVWSAMIKAIKSHLHDCSSISFKGLKDMVDYQKVKEKLVIIPESTKKIGMLEYTLGFTMDDIPMLVGVDAGSYDNAERAAQISAIVNKRALDTWGVSEEQVLVDAMVNQAEKDKPEMMRIGEMLAKLHPALSCLHEYDAPLYVVTTESHMNGAKVISYPGFLDSVCEKLGGNIYIIPSSKHEVICFRDDLVREDNTISEFIQETNRRELMEGEVLSDHLYHYEKDTATFETVEAYKNRKFS